MAVSADDVRSRADLITFLEGLAVRAEATPLDWENDTLPRFIAGASRWVDDMDGWYRNNHRAVPEEPSWELIAYIFDAARVYE